MKKLLLLSLFLLSYNCSKAQGNSSNFTHEEIDSLYHSFVKKNDISAAMQYSKIGLQKCLDESGGKKDSLYAVYAAGLGYLYKKIGKHSISQKYHMEELTIYKSLFGVNHPTVAEATNNLAILYRIIGNYTEAEKLLLHSKDIREKIWGKEHPKYTTSLINLARLYKSTNAYKKALTLLRQALVITEKIEGKDTKKYGYIINNMAGIYLNLERYDEAEKFYLQTLKIWEKLKIGNTTLYAGSMTNLGGFYKQVEKYDQSLLFFEKARDITEKTIGKNTHKYIVILNSIADLYTTTQEFDKAEVLFLKTLKISKDLVKEKHPILTKIHNSIARLYLESNAPKKATYHIQKAILNNILEKIDTVDFKTLPNFNFTKQANTLLSIEYLLQITQKEPETQANLLKRHEMAQTALVIQEKSRYDLDSQKDKLRILKNTFFLDELVYTASLLNQKKYKKASLKAVEKNKSALLVELFQTKAAQKQLNLPDSIIVKERKLNKQLLSIKKEVYLSANTPNYEKALDQLTDMHFTIDKWKKTIKQQYPKYYEQKYPNITISIDEIQSLLDDKTILLEYFVSSKHVYVYSISKTDFELIRLAISEQKLFSQVKRVHQSLSNYNKILSDDNVFNETYGLVAHQLYQAIIVPALQNKIGNKLLLIPDNYLGFIPFEALLTRAIDNDLPYNQQSYLINQYTVSYNYSATLWKENRNGVIKKNNKQLLGIAADYPLLDSSLLKLRTPEEFQKRIALQPLPAAATEVKSLSKMAVGKFLWGTNANERSFKQYAKEYNIIHLATHGILDKKYPLLSSLALTENLDSTQNNFLQAYEIASMELNANLIVLSACETGFGKFEQGEGIMSLARSFMYAGTPSLVVSLWSVNDQSTSIIMQDFYKNLIANMPKNEALRQAKLNYIQRAEGVAAHPAFWSPFIQLGNEEVIVIQTKSSSIYWFIGIGSILVLFLGITFFLKQKK